LELLPSRTDQKKVVVSRECVCIVRQSRGDIVTCGRRYAAHRNIRRVNGSRLNDATDAVRQTDACRIAEGSWNYIQDADPEYLDIVKGRRSIVDRPCHCKR